jgi:hypothetical protein
MCEGTVLPHWGHLFRCGACQRLAALRVRNRILDVLRFGTPMAAATKACRVKKTNVIRNWRFVIRCNDSTI